MRSGPSKRDRQFQLLVTALDSQDDLLSRRGPLDQIVLEVGRILDVQAVDGQQDVAFLDLAGEGGAADVPRGDDPVTALLGRLHADAEPREAGFLAPADRLDHASGAWRRHREGEPAAAL